VDFARRSPDSLNTFMAPEYGHCLCDVNVVCVLFKRLCFLGGLDDWRARGHCDGIFK
jgi:hypothetical protein